MANEFVKGSRGIARLKLREMEKMMQAEFSKWNKNCICPFSRAPMLTNIAVEFSMKNVTA